MKIAITGASGLMGQALTKIFAARHTVAPLTHADADITKRDDIQNAIGRIGPEWVIHPAAIPDLDICEADPARAFLVNVHGTRHIVEIAAEIGAGVAYISTDAVFNGKKLSPYFESDPPNPLTVYGRTKLRAEEWVRRLPRYCIFRVSVLFGPGKTNFIEKGIERLAAGQEYIVASDQLGSATFTLDAARVINEVLESGLSGLFHLSNQGQCTRYELMRRAAALAGVEDKRLVGKPAEEMGRRAARLKYAVMEMRALREAGIPLPRHWQEALSDYIKRRVWARGSS